MTTTSDRSTPRTGRLPRRSRRGLIVNLSAAQAVTLLVAVLLVAASVPMVGVGAAFWVALLAAGPLAAAALVRRDGFPVVEWAPIVWHFWRRRWTRQSGFRVTAAPRPAGKLALPGEEARLLALTAPTGRSWCTTRGPAGTPRSCGSGHPRSCCWTRKPRTRR